MKNTCTFFPEYPQWLNYLRSLCKFFHNVTYRLHLRRTLRGRAGDLDVDKLLKEFTASFAKWRYETMVEVLRQLGPLRELCESYIVRPLLDVSAVDESYTT